MPERIRFETRKTVEGVVRKVTTAVPLTLRGGLFLALSGGLLIEGVIRSELGALLCGAGLAAAIFLSLAGVFVERGRYTRSIAKDPEALEVRIGEPRRDEQEGQRCVVSAMNLGVPAPISLGVAASVLVRVRAANGRTAFAEIPLPKVEARSTADLPEKGSLGRGLYRGVAELRARDVFGFCSAGLIAVRDLEATAWPLPSEPPEARVRGSWGERPEPSDRSVRSEERFDSRPYVPGDDPRGIHWKQYARFGDLFVRPGDPTPPPRGTLRVYVDTERPSYLSDPDGLAYLDTLASRAMEFAERAAAAGHTVVCSARGTPDAPADRTGMRRWFAGLVWGSFPEDDKNPGPEPLVLFGAPGCVRRARMLSERTARGQETVLYIPELPPVSISPLFARIFLEPRPERRKNPGRAVRAAFKKAVEREIREFRRPGGVDVRVV